MIFLLINLLLIISTCIGLFFINLKSKFFDVCLSISIGIMLSSSILSLLFKALNLSNKYFLILLSLLIGYLFIYIINNFFTLKGKTISFLISFLLHNIPEGLSIGVLYASKINMISFISYSSSIIFQNIADGMILVSILIKMKISKKNIFILGFVFSLIDPISSILGLIIINKFNLFLPYFLSFSFGTSIYVILNDLIYDIKNLNKKELFLILGFIFTYLINFYFE